LAAIGCGPENSVPAKCVIHPHKHNGLLPTTSFLPQRDHTSTSIYFSRVDTNDDIPSSAPLTHALVTTLSPSPSNTLGYRRPWQLTHFLSDWPRFYLIVCCSSRPPNFSSPLFTLPQHIQASQHSLPGHQTPFHLPGQLEPRISCHFPAAASVRIISFNGLHVWNFGRREQRSIGLGTCCYPLSGRCQATERIWRPQAWLRSIPSLACSSS
jgi:hypothetical protein